MGDDKKSLKLIEKGYNAAIKDYTENKEKCIQFYTDGYKSGFRDGYKAAMEELMSTMPPEIRKKMIEEDAELRWPIPW
jgi:nitrogenase molybdenum-iron protein alpha/beta subunit